MRTRRSQFSSDPVSPQGHQPVLLHEAISSLAIVQDDVVVDATLGGAGHAKAISGQLGKNGTLIGLDLDQDAIHRAGKALAGTKPKIHLLEANFRNIEREVASLGVRRITKVLFDLGWSSYQLDSGRGFSIRADEPLRMTYSNDPKSLTAAMIVNEWQESSIADILYGWGEERYSRRIAKAIVQRRHTKPFTSALDLAETIKAAVPPGYRFGRIHPATRSFQALRIAVNDELGALSEGLQGAWKTLASGGRIAVITFHSIEDRVVKQLFREWECNGEGSRINKKPLAPTREEIAKNPRSRSAKLRVIQKS